MSFGERIKSARAAAKLSLRGLSDAVGVSHTQIAKYESGADMPSSGVLIKLADALGQSVDYFFRASTVTLSQPCWRRKASMGVKAERALLADIQDWLERYLAAESIMAARDLDGWNYVRPTGLRSTVADADGAEAAANELRREWDLGTDSIENLAELLETKGVKVWFVSGDDAFDGCFLWANDELPVIVVNSSRPLDRQRFDLSHELGHLLFGDVEDERLIHRFAAALLFPAEMVLKEFGSHRKKLDVVTLHLLKHKYGLSMQAVARRARDSDIITQSTYVSLVKYFRMRGWHKCEPGDTYRGERGATRMQRLILGALSEGVITESRASELLGQPLDEYTRSFELEHGVQLETMR